MWLVTREIWIHFVYLLLTFPSIYNLHFVNLQPSFRKFLTYISVNLQLTFPSIYNLVFVNFQHTFDQFFTTYISSIYKLHFINLQLTFFVNLQLTFLQFTTQFSSIYNTCLQFTTYILSIYFAYLYFVITTFRHFIHYVNCDNVKIALNLSAFINFLGVPAWQICKHCRPIYHLGVSA